MPPAADPRFSSLRDALKGIAIRGSLGSVTYHLRDCIGEGGQGWVFKANWDDPSGIVVIVKVLRPDAFGTESLKRFRREAEVLKMLSTQSLPTPYIVRFFDHAIAEVPAPVGNDVLALPFTVLEYVHGPTLENVMKALGGRGMAVERVRRLGKHVSQALDFVHAHKIVHRDLKPSNILLATEGGQETAKVTDFGLVKLTDMSLQRTAALAGASLGYAPPEQYEQGNERVSSRTDVFSFAAILYEMLSNKPAFPFKEGENPLLIVTRIVSSPRPQLRKTRDSLPLELATRIDLIDALDKELQRALAADPDARHETSAALFRAIEPILKIATESNTAPMPVKTGPSGFEQTVKKEGLGPAPPGVVVVRPSNPQMQVARPSAGMQAAAPVGQAPPSPAAHPSQGSAPQAQAVHPSNREMRAVQAPGAPERSPLPPMRAPQPSNAGSGGRASLPSSPGFASGGNMIAARESVSMSAGQPNPGAWAWSMISPPLTLGSVRWAVLANGGETVFAVGPSGLATWRAGRWYAIGVPFGLDLRLVRGFLPVPRSQDLILFGERGFVGRLSAPSAFEAWTLPDRDVTFLGGTTDEGGTTILVGERPYRGPMTRPRGVTTAGVIAQFAGPKLLVVSEAAQSTRLNDVTRLASGKILACGDFGAVVRLEMGVAEHLGQLCGGHLLRLAPLPDGGAVVVGAGGHALHVSPRFEHQLEAVQTTRDMLAVHVAEDGTAWAGSAGPRVLVRSRGNWIRMSGEVGLQSNVVAVFASTRNVRAVCDDGALIEGKLVS